MATRTASENRFPLIRLVPDAEDLTPTPSGEVHLRIDSSDLSLYWVDDTGTRIDPGTAIADVVDLPTAETDDTLVLAPDGAGGVEWRAETGGGGGGGLLAVHRYNPGSDGSYAVTGTTLADLDATNAAITFTAPASGAVLILVDVLCAGTMSGGDPSWMLGLRNGGSQIGDLQMIANGTAGIERRGVSFHLTGLTPSASYTIKLASKLASSGGIGTIYFGSSTRGGVNLAALAA